MRLYITILLSFINILLGGDSVIKGISVPQVIKLGLFDVKLKYGSVLCTPERTVQAFEIELPPEDGGYSEINGIAYPIENDRLICAKPGARRMTRPPFRCYYIHIEPDNSEICKILQDIPDTVKLRNPNDILRLFKSLIFECGQDGQCFGLSFYARLLDLIEEIKKESDLFIKGNTEKRHANTAAIANAVEYIDRHYAENLSLDGLAGSVFLSPIYFRNLFCDTVGKSPYEYILEKRIEHAKRMLSVTDAAISEIAEACGFSSQSHFGGMFKRCTGLTPRKYRIEKNKMYP